MLLHIKLKIVSLINITYCHDFNCHIYVEDFQIQNVNYDHSSQIQSPNTNQVSPLKMECFKLTQTKQITKFKFIAFFFSVTFLFMMQSLSWSSKLKLLRITLMLLFSPYSCIKFRLLFSESLLNHTLYTQVQISHSLVS